MRPSRQLLCILAELASLDLAIETIWLATTSGLRIGLSARMRSADL